MDSSGTDKGALFLSTAAFRCVNGTIFNITSSTLRNVFVIDDCNLTQCTNTGTVNNCLSFVMRNSAFLTASASGVTFTGANANLSIKDSQFRTVAGTCFDLGSATFTTLDISRNLIAPTTGETFLSGVGAANVSIAGTIHNNIFSGLGTYVTGITASDTNWLWTANVGVTNTTTGTASASQGIPGFAGADGDEGMPGVPGAQGIAGSQGAQGVAGIQGFPGAIGMPGEDGEDGMMGIPGPVGATGPAGGGGSGNFGEATLNFGSFPGASDTSVTVTGQAAITANSYLNAWLTPKATADHSADEHLVETISVKAGNIVPGTGFTIYGFNYSQVNEPVTYPIQRTGGGRGTRIYGQWTCQWSWA